MINDLINKIAIKLDSNFNGCQIYKENVEQGLEEPCFLVVVLDNFNTKKVNVRYYREFSLDIHYFPKNKIDSNNELYEVGEKLSFILENIDNNYNGFNIRYEIINDVLHFFITYKVFVNKVVEPVVKMNKLITNTGAKQ